MTLQQQLDAFERSLIVHALEAQGGNRTHAAADLGISYRVLLRRCEALAIPLDARANQHTANQISHDREDAIPN